MHSKQCAEITETAQEFFREGLKISSVQQMGLYQIIEKNPECTTRIVIEKYVQEDKNFDLTVRHVNRLRNIMGTEQEKGTPFQRGSRQGKPGRRCSGRGETGHFLCRITFF